ncbi:BadF/BadG/BcrA/BcrD ATPase family protein [Leifsonia sp. 1010]|uniref:N-acetylglucosamine kinase n=1 Tax=Leifsonia sp. 1010 TaxID=2817769 RepID=UPI00286338D5|nr:BadF/BadG/BcrA/BcrD ATPase family protein [Leifsonia sp. 1010]MDR6612655.1 N-acetylglucosamine kinase-like BadF-type ATPase [Leifsonia sp. 1010]
MTDDNAPTAPLVIAVDGGGSKTDAVALELDGTVVAEARGTTSSPHLIGMRGSADLVSALIGRLLEQTGPRPIAAANLYLSGLDLPTEIDDFRASIAGTPWAAATVDNDLFALLRAGTDEPDAVAVVCGTGINCVGVRADGAVVRYPSLGTISGDWGGGWHLGERALWHAARAVDGRGPATELAQAVPAAFGLDSVQAVIEALHFGRLQSRDLALLAPAVFASARAGDAVAAALIDEQAEEIVTFAATTLRRLDLLDRPVPVVLGGGVIGGRDERLLGTIERLLAERAPAARMELVTAAPILGAALLALESAGADPAALDAARRTLEERPAAVVQ